MTDIVLGLLVLGLVSALAFRGGQRFSHRIGPRGTDLAILLSVVGILVYVAQLWNEVHLTRLLPFSNFVIVGNWFPPLAGLTSGLVWSRIRGQARRMLFVGSLTTAAWFSAVHPLQGEPPECEDRWRGDVCMQTTRFTCSAACAATVLEAHGIPATEDEMARLCLTRNGTSWKGLYRGLKQKTAGTGWDVEVFEGSLDDLERLQPGPMILSVELPADADNHYHEDWGWIPGQPHSVVLYEIAGDSVRMGDPTVGREVWKRDDLRLLWRGYGLRLVPREPNTLVAFLESFGNVVADTGRRPAHVR